MLAQGFMDEVRRLRAMPGLHAELPAMRAVGYRQAWDYLAGNITDNQLRDSGIAATRQLAKRQLTWLRSWADIHWLHTEEPFELQKVTKAALKTLLEAGI